MLAPTVSNLDKYAKFRWMANFGGKCGCRTFAESPSLHALANCLTRLGWAFARISLAHE
jgi:hypothetical protein